MCKGMKDILDREKCKQLNGKLKSKALLETAFKHNKDIRELIYQDRESYLCRRDTMRNKMLDEDRQFKCKRIVKKANK
eukprot:7789125-Ditylum_brightwellii.AAC.1